MAQDKDIGSDNIQKSLLVLSTTIKAATQTSAKLFRENMG
jgi:hypothetical protein